LDVLILMVDMILEVIALRWRGATVDGLPFMAFVLLWRDNGGFPMVVPVVVALAGVMECMVLTPHWRRWLDTGSTLLVLTQVLTHVLFFEFQVGGLGNG
jgi:hypothetical protein